MLLRLTASIQFFRRIKSVVGMAQRNQFVRVLEVDFFPVALTVWAVRATKTHAFVRQEPYPAQGFNDIIFRSWHISALIGVLNSKNKSAALLASKEVIVQCRAHAANMQRTSGRRSKSYANHRVIKLKV